MRIRRDRHLFATQADRGLIKYARFAFHEQEIVSFLCIFECSTPSKSVRRGEGIASFLRREAKSFTLSQILPLWIGWANKWRRYRRPKLMTHFRRFLCPVYFHSRNVQNGWKYASEFEVLRQGLNEEQPLHEVEIIKFSWNNRSL